MVDRQTPQTSNEPDRTLDNQATRIWALLTQACADKTAPWNRPAIATVGADGSPQVRTVILRACRPDDRVLEFHTDNRSSKVVELQSEARMCWHFWDPSAQLQLRVAARADLSRNCDTARRAWTKLHPASRAIYAQAVSPGTGIDNPGGIKVFDDDFAFANFVVVETEVEIIEMLHITANGQRRAIFEWSEVGRAWVGQWLAP